MACAYYDTEQACTGGTPIVVNVQYDLPDNLAGQRISGTHLVTASSDALGLGRCAWVAGQPDKPCLKDSNNRKAGIPWKDGIIGDDCLETQGGTGVPLATCFRDTLAPQTIMPFDNNTFLRAEVLRTIPPIVEDDTYELVSTTATYGCIVDSGQSCYPTEPLANAYPDTIGVAAYTIFYYSVDPSGNLERVKRINLNIENPGLDPYLIDVTLVGE